LGNPSNYSFLEHKPSSKKEKKRKKKETKSPTKYIVSNFVVISKVVQNLLALPCVYIYIFSLLLNFLYVTPKSYVPCDFT